MASGFNEGGDNSPEYEGTVAAVNAQLGSGTSGIPIMGKLAYSPDQLKEIIRDWRELAISYQYDLHDTAVITSVEAPGRDDPGRLFAEVVRGSGAALRRSLTEERDFCLRQAARFEAALAAYQGVEHDKKREFDQQGQGTVL